jgi:hypothetical protein
LRRRNLEECVQTEGVFADAKAVGEKNLNVKYVMGVGVLAKYIEQSSLTL